MCFAGLQQLLTDESRDQPILELNRPARFRLVGVDGKLSAAVVVLNPLDLAGPPESHRIGAGEPVDRDDAIELRRQLRAVPNSPKRRLNAGLNS